ncbi:MalY/PatB family protein [Lysinibacillus sp. LZ02]|uniref:MalY/PatB family protein n=1 Tax=Lysinibacillus sp. LZ02 TaxID=3420668 RepID=UPI003D3631BC
MSVFNQVYPRRNTRSLKWDKMEKVYNMDDASELLAMWVADMDFAPPQAVVDALHKRLEHPIFGYSLVDDHCKNAIVSWFERRHNWTIDPNLMLFHSGVVPAIANIVSAFTEPNDKIVVSTPIYPPFFNVPKNQKRDLIMCDLHEENGTYRFNFDTLEAAFKEAKMYILCNPHNPGGMTWSQQDLEKIIELAIQHDVFILSDEIHADLLIGDNKHIPLLTVARANEANIITCIAPTKTFNIAGIQAAMTVSSNVELKRALEQYGAAHGLFELNAFVSTAVEATYTEGDAWLDELRTYLSNNMDYVIEELTKIPGIHIQKPQATYLIWIDYRETGIEEKDMMNRLLTIGKLALDPGTKYSEAGRGFLRMNVAAPFETIQEGVERFKKALQK